MKPPFADGPRFHPQWHFKLIYSITTLVSLWWWCPPQPLLAIGWTANVTCRSVGMGAQLPPWCLFVSLDFRPYVTPEGFEPSRHKLDPGWQRQGITPVPPMPPVQDSTSQRMSSSLNAHSESDPAHDYAIQSIHVSYPYCIYFLIWVRWKVSFEDIKVAKNPSEPSPWV